MIFMHSFAPKSNSRAKCGKFTSWLTRLVGDASVFVLAGACWALVGQSFAAEPAKLTIGDGVVVKFAPAQQPDQPSAGILVRSQLVTAPGVTFTSAADDRIGGQAYPTPGSPKIGDWWGVFIAPSVNVGDVSMNGLTIRYAGSQVNLPAKVGSISAGLTLPAKNFSFDGLRLDSNSVGIRVYGGGSPSFTKANINANTVGLQVESGATPVVSQSSLLGNTSYAILNLQPASVVQAEGNWWGHSSGPKQTATNPMGQGNPVSEGVNYGSFVAAGPLLNPSIRLASPAPYFEQRTISLLLSCTNATEFRVAEAGQFAGVPFQALTNGQVQIPFVVSEGDGQKSLSVQFRNGSGTVVTANLDGSVRVDTTPPLVRLISPAPGSLVNGRIALEAVAEDGSGISQLQFFVDGQLFATKNAPPFVSEWDTSLVAEGIHTIKVLAKDAAGRTSEQSTDVTVSRAPPQDDRDGPAIANLVFDGLAIANGSKLAGDGTLSVAVSDRSGVARVEVLLDGNVVAVASGSGAYSTQIDWKGIAAGSHTLAIKASDSVGNVSNASFSITVEHLAPTVPVIDQPVNGSTTRTATLTVAGQAQSGVSVQLLLNGQPSGSALPVGTDGRFGAAITLVSGSNSIQASASNASGTSALSAPVQVTLDVSVPVRPSSLLASALAGGKVRLNWTRSTDPNVTGYVVFRSNAPFVSEQEAVKITTSALAASVSLFEDLPPADGLWVYRVAAVNSAGTLSELTNAGQATSDGTAPKAVSISYTSQGKTDAATGRMGQGVVSVVLKTNEALQMTPYLSVVPEGGAPIPVELTRSSDTEYRGTFLISSNTPSGVANALFSARDVVGNRGTDIDAGASIRVDTEGPVLSNIVLSPTAPIKNDTAQTLQVTFTLSKKPSSVPQFKFLLSGPVRSPVTLSSVSQVNPTTFSASFSLPSDAGLGTPESLSFSHISKDDLDNVSNKVSALNRFQVYQGNLPPLDVPYGFTAKAQAQGKVRLTWQEVEQATSYQLYRQAPGAAVLTPLIRTGGTEYIDQTPADGVYKYAIATVRQSNGQESVSGQSAVVEVQSSATAPGAPQNLTLSLTGQGILATWQPPLSSTVDHYRLYRGAGTVITSVDGLTPYKDRLKTTQVVDASPSPTHGAYVVTSVDAAGNESAISNSSYLNASLLPVRDLAVEQIGGELPLLRWSAPNGNIAGYLVYVGPEGSRTKLTPAPIVDTRMTDTGYTSGDRRYTIATVDANGVEMPRAILLPSVSSQIVSGLPIKRGVMNKLHVQVVNTSPQSIDGAKVVVRLPINRDATQFKDHKSEVFSLASNETKLIPVVVGGYADLPGAPRAQVGVEISPVEGELVKVARYQTLAVSESSLVVGMSTDEFTRGATGKLKLTIENTSDVDVELLTATDNGANPSNELRFKILDGDGNVLATQAYKQVFGASVVTLTNGQTVARIPAGSKYVSDVFLLNVPSASPNSIRVRLEVDKLRYHTGQEDELSITGRGSEKTVSLLETAYYGAVTDVSPISSFGDKDVVIKGRALDRSTQAPMSNTRLKLVLNQQGFERVFSVLTDASGNFEHIFKPTITDAGLYKVSAVHPEITDRPEQKSFTINRITVGPTPFKIDLPKNYPFNIPFVAKAGAGTSATNLRLLLNPSDQPTGQVPQGVSVQLPSPVNIQENQSLNLPVTFSANNDAQPSGSLILSVTSDEHGGAALGLARVDYKLSEARPYLVSTPTMVETGMSQGGNQIEKVIVKNNGLQDAINLRFTLTKSDGNPAPNWATMANQANGSLTVGQSVSIDLSFAPPASTPEGIYELKLNVVGDNIPAQSLNVYVNLTQSGQGNVLFKASDIYTATVGKDGKLIPGLAGASITMQNEDVPSVSQELLTDALGEALFEKLPAGRYKFRARATNHQEVGGRLVIKPGVTANQSVFLNYNVINVEWSVREITIQDRYEITLNATFETDVPAAVVMVQPTSINLPKMAAGDVYYGELNITNYGLIRADAVKQHLPQSDAYFRYEFLVEVPKTLEAKQRVTIPYRVISLQSLETAASSANASGGGCYSYSTSFRVECEFTCKNGEQSTCGSSASWFSVSNSSCGGGAGGPYTPGASSGISWPGGAGGYGGGSSSTIKMPGKKCVYVASRLQCS